MVLQLEVMQTRSLLKMRLRVRLALGYTYALVSTSRRWGCMQPSHIRLEGSVPPMETVEFQPDVQMIIVAGARHKLLDAVCDNCMTWVYHAAYYRWTTVRDGMPSTGLNITRKNEEAGGRLTPARMTMSSPHLEVPKSCCRTLVTSHRRMQMVNPAQKARRPVRLHGAICF